MEHGQEGRNTSMCVLTGEMHRAVYTSRGNHQEHVTTGKEKSWGQTESQGWELSEKWEHSCGKAVPNFLDKVDFFDSSR